MGLCVTVGDRVPPRPAVYRGGRRSVFHMYQRVQDHTVDLALQSVIIIQGRKFTKVQFLHPVDLVFPFSCLRLAYCVRQAPEEAASS